MLLTQKFLNRYGLEKLKSLYGIEVNVDANGQRFILNYGIKSPKTKKIVSECRGLILDNNWNIVARSFRRFFNYLENPQAYAKFNWQNFHVEEKLDGSLALLYYWNGLWRFATRGSFGDALVNDQDFTWEELFWDTLKLNQKDLRLLYRDFTYVFELTSPYNRVVINHKKPKLHLLTVVNNVCGNELNLDARNYEADILKVEVPRKYDFKSAEELVAYLEKLSNEKQLFEGCVARDSNDLRVKFKSRLYVWLHKHFWCGKQLTEKNFLELYCMSQDEQDEFLTYFPEEAYKLSNVHDRIEKSLQELNGLWSQTRSLTNQKDFALSIIGKHPAYSLLFEARKAGVEPVDILLGNKGKWSELLYEEKSKKVP